ncbi:MAG: NADP-dependent oxidoreductase [Holophagales bacterium]|nr:NADP-dependent oxidoreductase [Holophagales bacterium]
MTENRQIIIDSLPTDRLEPGNYALRTVEAPAPGDGEVLCRTLAITIGAGQRAGLQGSASYAGAPRAGIVMSGTAVARVEASSDDAVPVGSLVVCPAGWQDYSVHAAAKVRVVDDGSSGGDPAHHLGVYGTNGLTAYFGLFDVGEQKEGQTVLVSAAAGSVGHLVGQMAKIVGCRVVGVAGGEAKCRLLTEELGFDAAVDYKSPSFRSDFKEATPDRIDIYFDNTGGEVLGSALRRMKVGGRIVCCGVVSQYDTSKPAPGPFGVPGLLINFRVRMEGFLVFDYAKRYPEAWTRMREWVEAGKLVPKQDVFEGLEKAPEAFVDLLAGGNVGTRIVRVAS